MKNSFQNKAIALIIAVLLVVGMSPVAFARAKDRGTIKLEKFNVKLAYGASVTLWVEYDGVEDKSIFRARADSDKSDVAAVDFGMDGGDVSSIVITAGEIDGKANIYVSAGGATGVCVVTVGRGDKTPEQIKKEEAAAKAEKAILENDDSELGKALADALKKATEKQKSVTINTTAVKTPVIPVNTMKALAARANQAKKNALVRIDVPDANGNLQARLFVDPTGFSNIKSDFKTGVTVDKSRASLGSKYIASVKLAHTGSFLMFTEVAVKVSAPKDVSKLSIYNVDANGKLEKIEEPSCSVDKNGMLSFYTKQGGEIVIVNGTL